MNFVTSKEARDYFHISATTLKLWKDSGKIQIKAFSNKKILYDIDSVSCEGCGIEKMTVIYAKSDDNDEKALNDQVFAIKQYLITNGIVVDEVFTDMGQEFNKDSQLFKLMTMIKEGNVKSVYIMSKAALSLNGFKYFEAFSKNLGTDIKVLDKSVIIPESTQKALLNTLSNEITEMSLNFTGKYRSTLDRVQSTIIENLRK